jgi:glycosyltransferase involved in cell wall biosynthesis
MAGGLKILHVMRSPVGGLFRHVVDLARAQIAQGHLVGLIADSSTGGPQAEVVLAELAPKLALGLVRVAMSRQVGPRDVVACAHVSRRAADVEADVVHGHGAKGGAYARLTRVPHSIRVYTPHGGSLHYTWNSPTGFLYLTTEREMMPRTDLFLFESAYGLEVFRAKVGDPGARARVVHNGVIAAEFEPVATHEKASDLVFVGEMRLLKGVDLLIKAIAMLAREGRSVTASLVGEGPDRKAFEAEVQAQKLDAAIRFVGARPARTAFAFGRLMVVPSRAESLPYIVLEAAAAGLPLIATRVGGIPEIFGPDAGALVVPNDAAALAKAIAQALDNLSGRAEAAQRLQSRIRADFSADAMSSAVLHAYQETLAQRNGLARRHG